MKLLTPDHDLRQTLVELLNDKNQDEYLITYKGLVLDDLTDVFKSLIDKSWDIITIQPEIRELIN